MAAQFDAGLIFINDGLPRRVTVVSTISSQPPMITDELRRQADVFTDLVELQSRISLDPAVRPAPRQLEEHFPSFVRDQT
jgi:hypothetical protein